MSGGFTLSGGEPLMQDRFAVKLLIAAKGMGIDTALDTSGGLGARLSNTAVLLDLKCWNPELHRANRHGKWASAGFCSALGRPRNTHLAEIRFGSWIN